MCSHYFNLLLLPLAPGFSSGLNRDVLLCLTLKWASSDKLYCQNSKTSEVKLESFVAKSVEMRSLALVVDLFEPTA